MTTAKQNEYGPQDCIKRLREEADDIITEEGSRRIARLMQRSAAAIQELLNENDALRERFVADHSADMLGMVDATDHPDYIGGIVWSDCELRPMQPNVELTGDPQLHRGASSEQSERG